MLSFRLTHVVASGMCPARTHPCPIACAGPNTNPGAANLSSPPNRNADTFQYPHANVGTHDYTGAHANAGTHNYTGAHANAGIHGYTHVHVNTRAHKSSNIDACCAYQGHANALADFYSSSCTRQHSCADQYPRRAGGLPVDAPSNRCVIYRA